MDEESLNVVNSRFHRRGCVPLFVLVLIPLLGCVLTISTKAASFTNVARILIQNGVGPGSIYPSPINVSNLFGAVSSVAVALPQVAHANPDDLDIMLVGPGPFGPTNIMLMSDAGGTNDLNGPRLVYTNFVTATAPQFPPDSTTIFGGNYRPSNYGLTGDSFPSNSFVAPYNTNLSAFNGADPNGPWHLYVVDDFNNGLGGSITGWELVIQTVISPPVIVKQPSNRVAKVNATVTFNVGVTGSPPFQFQWLRNGSILVPFGQGSSNLTVFVDSPCDAAEYQVQIRNPANVTVSSRIARLDVDGPIGVCGQVGGVIRPKLGEDVELRANATGTPPLIYQWTLNGMVIPGETNATLLLPNVQAASGGEYAVMIWNGDEAITRTIAIVAVDAATGPRPTDMFAQRPLVRTLAGVLQENSEKFTKEAGEPVLPGGGRTAWFEWVPPNTGIATINLRGSSFDTMLQVFRRDAAGAFVLVTKDDDRDGFYTSTVQFNAARDVSYYIQIDGFGRNAQGEFGDGGEFTVRFSLEIGQELIPEIVNDPKPAGVLPGKPARFRVVVGIPGEPVPDVSYQWFFQGRPISIFENSTATSATLVIASAKSEDVGFYHVRIRRGERTVTTFPVDLQLTSTEGVLLHDKFERLFLLRSGNGGQAEGGALAMFAPAGGGLDVGFVSIGLGDIDFGQASSVANKQKGDPNPCGSPFIGTLWRGLSATNNGKIMVSTEGSTIFARLGIYELSGGFSGPPIFCDITNAPNGKQCNAVFNARAGTDYTIVVEGYQVSGSLVVTSTMGYAPVPPGVMEHCMVPPGGSITLSMPGTNWVPQPFCQWRFNGELLLNETNATLQITDFDDSNIGLYSVWMSNFVSAVTCDVAQLSIAPPFTLQHLWTTNSGTVGFSIIASNFAPFVIETTTNLSSPWQPVITNKDHCNLLFYTNSLPFAAPQRFYRAVPWSP